MLNINRYGEQVVVSLHGGNGQYYVCRDKQGLVVLREGGPDGQEHFSPVLDDEETKNTKKERVSNVYLLYAAVDKLGGCPYPARF